MDHSKSLLFSLISYIILFLLMCTPPVVRSATVTVDVGVILDMDSYVGKMGMTSLNMALDDFYASHQNYTTRLVLHTRDSKGDAVEAASAAIELIKDYQTKAILGPQLSVEAEFVAKIGNRSHVPIVSFSATGTLVSHLNTPYFIRMAEDDTFQLQAIAAIVDFFNWSRIVPIYEGTDYGSGILAYLSDKLQEIGVMIPYRCAISSSATDDQILKELYRLMTMQTRVFVVHMLPSLASRVLLKAKEAGMMSKGYAWIVTAGIIDDINSMDSSDIDSMQGVIGVRPYIPKSAELDQFEVRWMQKFHEDYSEIHHAQPNVFALWAYDSISVLAMAVENAGIVDSEFIRPTDKDNLTDLLAIGASKSGPSLLESILTTRLKGLSGNISLINGQLPLSPFQIVNLVRNESKEVGFWKKCISQQSLAGDLEAEVFIRNITWPGNTTVIPKGWELPVNEKKKLRVGVPVKAGFSQFINVERDQRTNEVIVSGYCKEVFEAALGLLPYAVRFEYVPFEAPDGSGESAGSYDDLVYEVYNKKFDAVVGDITIRASRSEYVEFTLPFTESGVSMIVPVKDDEDKRAWIFLKPLTANLWFTIGGFFIYTGIVIWVLEHRVNEEFRGRPRKQFGTLFWFSFSTLVFAHRERISSNLSRFVLIVWFFVVLVLTQSYTANLTSMLTVQQLQPTVSDINELIKSGDYIIGYQDGSFIPELLKTLGADPSKLKIVTDLDNYNDELRKGLKNGGVSAIVDELPYLRLVLAKYCTKYKMVGTTYKAAGFGFAFPKGSPLVPDLSRALLNVTESAWMTLTTNSYFGNQANCSEQGDTTSVNSDSLSVESFKGLFLMTGLASTTALVIFFCNFLFQNKDILTSQEPVKHKIAEMAKTFDEKKESNDSDKKQVNRTEKEAQLSAFYGVPQGFIITATPSPGAISLSNQEEGMSYHDESLSTSTPGTPYHDFATTELETTPDRH